jgi:hypothetical protein
LRQLLHWPDLPFVLNQSTPPDLHCKEVEIPRLASLRVLAFAIDRV